MNLREELEALTNKPDISYEWIDEQPRKIEQLKQRYPHDIELYQLASKDTPYHNCYMHALDMTFDSIARWSQSGKRPNSIFIRHLLENGTLELINDSNTVPDGVALIYLDDQEVPIHAGIKSGNKVTSKWGYGYTHVWRHPELEAPASYGSKIKLFRSPDKDLVVRAYARWATGQIPEPGKP